MCDKWVWHTEGALIIALWQWCGQMCNIINLCTIFDHSIFLNHLVYSHAKCILLSWSTRGSNKDEIVSTSVENIGNVSDAKSNYFFAKPN